MARPRQPIGVIEAKGKKHLTKVEVETRKNNEIVAPSDAVIAPDYLNKKQKDDFDYIADQLIDIGIMTNLDCDSLANYIISLSNYKKFTRLVNKIHPDIDNLKALESAVSMQDKAFKQCRASASDLGLTISSRCKLVIPNKEEKQESKWDKFGAGQRA